MSRDVSERIKYLRNYKGIPNKTVAAREIGIPYGTYQRYEYGHAPKRSNYEKIASFYGCSLSWLMTGDGEPFPDGRPLDSETNYQTEKIASYGARVKDLQVMQGIKNKDESSPAFPNSSFDLAKAVELAVRVLGSGTSYAYALYLNVIHFDRAILAESRIAVLEKKCEALEKEFRKEIDILKEENRELRRQLNLIRESRERSEDLDPAAGQGSA